MRTNTRPLIRLTRLCIGGILLLHAGTYCSQSLAQIDLTPVSEILQDPSIPSTDKKNHLARLGKEQVPALIKYLNQHPDSWVQVVPALGDIGDRRAAEPLHALLSTDGTEPIFVIRALGRIKDPVTSDLLLSMIGGPYSGAAISALAEISEPHAVEQILALMRSQDESVIMRMHAASELAKFASKDARTEARDFLVQDEYLHELHREQKPEDHPYWSFPHDTWWKSLLEIGTDESYKVLASWLERAPMVHNVDYLIQLYTEIESPPRSVVDALLEYALNSEIGSMYLRVSALEALIGYGDALPKETLLSALDSLHAESESNGLAVPLQRLNDLRSDVDALWAGGFVSSTRKEPQPGQEEPKTTSQEAVPAPDPSSLQTAPEDEADELTSPKAVDQPEEPNDSRSTRTILLLTIGTALSLLTLAAYRVIAKKTHTKP